MWFVIILGIIAFLVMEHPVAFWLVFVPLAITFIVVLAKGLIGNTRKAIGSIVILPIILLLMILALLIICIP